MMGMTLIALMPILRWVGTLLIGRCWPGCPRTPRPNGALGVATRGRKGLAWRLGWLLIRKTSNKLRRY